MAQDSPAGVSPDPMRVDAATVDYFDSHPHHYSSQRISGVGDLVREYLPRGASICDVGAGGGETLDRLAHELDLSDLTAMDVSEASLRRARERLPEAKVAVVSVLDESAISPWLGTFDVVLVAAVLHHLVAGSRKRSTSDAQLGLTNAFRLAKPGGLVIVLEPVFQPRAATWLVFWIKRVMTRLTNKRLPVFGYWNNIGAPVVSFYGADQVRGMVRAAGGTIIAETSEAQKLGYADLVIRKHNLSVLARTSG